VLRQSCRQSDWTHKAGKTLFSRYGGFSVSSNYSKTKPAKLLAVFVVDG
jgi:hypothetical protein